MRRKVHERAPDVPVRFTTAAESLRENLASPRFLTALLAAFAALAVCLAMAGVYGVIAYIAGQRVSEIGLRMALARRQPDRCIVAGASGGFDRGGRGACDRIGDVGCRHALADYHAV